MILAIRSSEFRAGNRIGDRRGDLGLDRGWGSGCGYGLGEMMSWKLVRFSKGSFEPTTGQTGEEGGYEDGE